ncbi:MAG TPA: hypothetical protein VIT93_06740 [Dehalococcoidia bacterium]
MAAQFSSNLLFDIMRFLTFVAENAHGFDVPKIPWPEKDEHVQTITSLDLRGKVPSQIDEADRRILLAL